MISPIAYAKQFYHKKILEQTKLISEHAVAVNRMEYNALERTDSAIDPNSDLIVSLTTYRHFINEVHIAIESLMEQTYKPKKIILWISDAYKDSEIPLVLKRMENRGLEINRTKDLRSYTKLLPTLKAYTNNPIATFDDDLIYPYNTLEVLYKAYKENPNMIYFRRGHRMKLKSKNEFVPYMSFDWEIQDENIDIMNFPTGVGGVIYPPASLDDEVMNEKAFMSLSPFADDVWFKAMALKKGTLSRKVYSRKKPYIDLDILSQDVPLRLNAQNNLNNRNDTQIKAVWDAYNLWENY